nr:MAG TPA: hypothetical protein [Caudoviricetes sp.]
MFVQFAQHLHNLFCNSTFILYLTERYTHENPHEKSAYPFPKIR